MRRPRPPRGCCDIGKKIQSIKASARTQDIRKEERRTHRLTLLDVCGQSVELCGLWVMMMDKYVTQQLTTLVCGVTQSLSLLPCFI
jgi:hypothetical protein